MPALVAGIHVLIASAVKAWMAGTRPGHDGRTICISTHPALAVEPGTLNRAEGRQVRCTRVSGSTIKSPTASRGALNNKARLAWGFGFAVRQQSARHWCGGRDMRVGLNYQFR